MSKKEPTKNGRVKSISNQTTKTVRTMVIKLHTEQPPNKKSNNHSSDDAEWFKVETEKKGSGKDKTNEEDKL